MKTNEEIRVAVEGFLEHWHRGDWMVDHGEWASSLDEQVRSDDSDYIAEGVIDPDDVAGTAEALDVVCSWQGWDCTEGWTAYRAGDALYVHWFRNARGLRHDRSLWVLVDEAFFEQEEEL